MQISRTPEYRKAYAAAHYLKNKDDYKARSRRQRVAIRDLIRAAKLKPCADCKKRYPFYVMDFDHLPQFEKAYQLNQPHRLGLEKAKAEIAKCDVVCSNCHRERSHRRQTQGPVAQLDRAPLS